MTRYLTRRRIMAALTVLVAVIALSLVWHVLRRLSPQEVMSSIHHLRPRRLVYAGLFTAGSYLCLSGFDWFGLHYAGKPLPYPKVLLASFTSLSLGNTIGLAPFSSGAIRYRFYSRAGLTLSEVGRVVIFSALSVTIGEMSLATIMLLWRPDLASKLMHVTTGDARAIGCAGATFLAAYLAMGVFWRQELRIGSFAINWPRWWLILCQIAIGTSAYALEAGALRQALASITLVDYPTAATAFLMANLAAVASHVPGGLGVIEAAVLLLLPRPGIIGGVMAFRVIYFFLPFALGLISLAASEIWGAFTRNRGRSDRGDACPRSGYRGQV